MKIDERILVLATTKIIDFINNEKSSTKDFEIWIESQLNGDNEREILRSIANSCNSYHYNKRFELMKLTPGTDDYFVCEYHIAVSEILRAITMGYFNCL